MASSIVLNASVRQSLLALRDTADLTATTQTRLATGKKVNSALDNASSYFTAAALDNRASDLNALLDSVTNGIQVTAAANNGLTAITRIMGSMQVVLNQAGQSQTNPAASYTIGSIDTSSPQTMSFSGGSVGSTPVNVALTTTGVTAPATAATVTASADYVAPTAASGPTATSGVDFAALDTSNGNETYAFTVSKNGGAAVNVQLGVADGSLGSIWTDEAVTGINADLTTGGSTIRVRHVAGSTAWGKLQFYDTDAANTGTAATISVSDVTKGGTTPSGTLGWEGGTLTAQGADAANRVVTISDGTTTATATLTAANAATAAAARTAIQAAIDGTALVGTATVGGSANRINLTGLADGSNSITVGGADVDNVFGAGRTVTPGSPAATSSGTVKSVDQLVSAINGNAALTGKVSAFNSGGKLRIENISANALTVTGVAGGNIDGSGSTTTIAGTGTSGGSVSTALVNSFNDLRTRIDELASDSIYNGINLLKGDNLHVVFNEQGTSSLTVSGVTLNSAGLGLSTPLDDPSSNITSQLAALKAALSMVRTQASHFGSNLLVVQTREDFTKKMVSTLQTGANDLVLADTNQEGSNLLALQTRQSLSTTMLSLAGQSDQAVLKLFA